jgi:hypothetical protein
VWLEVGSGKVALSCATHQRVTPAVGLLVFVKKEHHWHPHTVLKAEKKMSTSSLWAEVTISGFLMFFALFFLTLKWLGIHDFSFFSGIKDYMTLLSIGVLAVSYVIGILVHRLIFIMAPPIFRFLRRQFRLNRNPQATESEFLSRSSMVVVWQYGSERLQQELDYQFNFLTLFTSMTCVLPVLGISAALWLVDTAAYRLAGPVLILGILFGIGFFVAYSYQSRRYRQLQEQALLEMENVIPAKKD